MFNLLKKLYPLGTFHSASKRTFPVLITLTTKVIKQVKAFILLNLLPNPSFHLASPPPMFAGLNRPFEKLIVYRSGPVHVITQSIIDQ